MDITQVMAQVTSGQLLAVTNRQFPFMFDSLTRRINEDIGRDPIDALNDCEMHCSLLAEVCVLLYAPETRYILASRLREDLASRNLNERLTEARIRRQYLELRHQEMTGKRLPTMPAPAVALHQAQSVSEG